MNNIFAFSGNSSSNSLNQNLVTIAAGMIQNYSVMQMKNIFRRPLPKEYDARAGPDDL